MEGDAESSDLEDSLSDVSLPSDASDMFHVSELSEDRRTWSTEQDTELACIDKLATRLRARPLLPVHPEHPDRVWEATSSGGVSAVGALRL